MGRRSVGVIVTLAVVGAGLALLAGGWLSPQRFSALYLLFSDPAHLRSLLWSYGVWTPVAFVVVQALQVIISPIPGEATGLLGGYLFGVGWGLFYSTIGLTVGSMFAFGMARWLETRFLERFVRMERLQALAFATRPEGGLVVFVLFLIPGFPKDILSYLLGLTPINVWTFLIISTLGRTETNHQHRVITCVLFY